MKAFHPQTKISFGDLILLERRGLYEQALADLKGVWTDTSEPPDTANLTLPETAELFLRCGSLIGFHGHNKQISEAQERSKNLLTEARQKFLELGAIEKIAECENYLALAYWRTGELNEAEAFIAESLSHPLDNSSRTRIYSHLIKILIFLSLGKFTEIEVASATLEKDFRNFGDAFLNGSLCTNWGIALRNLGRQSEALKKYELARYYHLKSGHQIYLGTVENNLAYLYKSEKQFAKAHEAVDCATKIFRKLKDRTREGFSLDSKAQIFLAEKKYAEALKVIDKAAEIMKKSENSAYLSETYLTKAKILLYFKGFTPAVLALFDAVKIAETNAGEAAAKKLVAEFEAELMEKSKPAENLPTEKPIENLKLILPVSLAHYDKVEVVRIKNEHLENLGLPKNSLAVVAQTAIELGDLTAVNEISTGMVVCGFYDSYCGIVSLEAKNGEPYLFDENEIIVLGKIIGVCRADGIAEDKMIVEPLNFQD